MHNVLFLLCPTDCLETIIDDTFNCQNYFYTSLGNSFTSDYKTINSIRELIIKHKIKNVCFVLSNDNEIIKDAFGEQYFSEINGLKSFYKKVSKEKELLEAIWGADHRKDSILSYFLNMKIKEFEANLGYIPHHQINIIGKIYNRFENSFRNIYSNITCLNKHILN
ncbi:hypothetical protein WH52_01075 [Tenacibaculum holothuriorum]|uniref:Uncharacterized protein n=1 Tax=Tenacibaculum holothuriorum TaxID=1635173 RepID=A0A1Y2PHK3_9FLAO|nr:hypothetical protein [Tenacibaculum holothuriorum]OSY89267.1 hypothetical protein WH52_01075 [Tenacibaculum holothuriorum]